MGIKGLAKLLADEAPDCIREVELKSLHGRKIAIDASMAIYQFLIAVRSGGGNQQAVMLTNADGETTSHIQGMFNRTIRFMTEGMKPVFVFDGKPPNLKRGELQKRRDKREQAEKALQAATEEGDVAEQDKHSKRLVRAGHKENADCQKLLELMGVPVILAPCEAEAQAAALAKTGAVYASATEDMDALTFQTPILLRKMTFAASGKNVTVQSINYEQAVSGLGLIHEQFVDLCILLGCDYCDTIKGVGPKTALKLIRENGTIENILKVVQQNSKFVIPFTWLPPKEEDGNGEKKKDDESDHGSRPDDEADDGKEAAQAETAKKSNEGEEEQEEETNEAPFVPDYVLARNLFHKHEVLSKDEVAPLLKWKPCQPEALQAFLVDEMGFSADRVAANIEKLQAAYKANLKPQARMDSFFAVKPKSTNNSTKTTAASKKRPAAGAAAAATKANTKKTKVATKKR